MKCFRFNLFCFTICFFIVIASVEDNDTHLSVEDNDTHLSVEDNDTHLSLEPQTTHESTKIRKIDFNTDGDMMNKTNDSVNYSQNFFCTEDLPVKFQSLKWKFPEATFDSCCSTIEKKQKYLKTCNKVFQKENIECVDATQGSIILELKSSRIDFEKGVLNALSGVKYIGGYSTKNHHKYEPNNNIEPKSVKVLDLRPICSGKVNQFVWTCPWTISSDISEEKILQFHTMNDQINSSSLAWYLKSINKIDIIEMDARNYKHQIQFHVKINEQTISLSRLYPTYPKISGFEILQFITNLAFQCKFVIEIVDLSDVSTVYSLLYGKSYYEYHINGIDLSQKFKFQKIIVKKKIFLNCFEEKISNFIDESFLSQLFYKNIQICENTFVSVEFCPIDFESQRIFYKTIFKACIDWLPIQQDRTLPFFQRFEITSEDIVRIMKRKKKQKSNLLNNFVKTFDNQIIKTYDQIKTEIFDTSFLKKLFSKIFYLCFFELEKQCPNPNPEDIFKIYLRPCVIPNINLFLKYYTTD